MSWAAAASARGSTACTTGFRRPAKKWGAANWVKPVLNVVFDGVSDTVNYQVQSLLTKAGAIEQYLRVQPTLTPANDDMDNASAENIEQLRTVGERMIAENDARLDGLVRKLLREPAVPSERPTAAPPAVAPAPTLPSP